MFAKMFAAAAGSCLLLLIGVGSAYGETSPIALPGAYRDKSDYYWESFSHHRPELLHECRKGKRQSPIDIPTSGNIKVQYEPMLFNHYDAKLTSKKLSNNGHTVKMTYTSDDPEIQPSVTGGGLGAKFVFAQLHFHWGGQDSAGSEHTIGNLRYPMELHMVHFNTKYGSDLGTVVSHSNDSYDTLAVLGIMFTLQEQDNPHLNPIVEALDEIKPQGNSTSVEVFPLENLLPENIKSFYRYSGSLTTPLCSEIVLWTVFKDPIGISHNQMEKFRALTFGKGKDKMPLVDNFRKRQPLNGRQIFEVSSSSKIQIGYTVLILTLSTFLIK